MSKVIEDLCEAVLTANPDVAKQTAEEALRQRIEPLDAMNNGLIKGIREVGERFGRGELFLTDLMMSAEAFKAGLSILEPELVKKKIEMKTIATVVLGTVQGDIHSIGKDIVGVLLSAVGFKVHNIGVDVPAEVFVEKVRELKPDIAGASALMSTTILEQKKILDGLEKAGLRSKVKFMIGGAGVSENWAKEIRTDAWALSADEAVRKAKELIEA
jgi:trimethylamine corrinoid protein